MMKRNLMSSWYSMCQKTRHRRMQCSSRSIHSLLFVPQNLTVVRRYYLLKRGFETALGLHQTNVITVGKNKTISKCFHDGRESDSESDSEESLDAVVDLYTEPEEVKDTDAFRQLLYPNSVDSLVLQLNACETVQEVFNIIHENELNAIQATQAVLVLWDLQKMYYKVNENTIRSTFAATSIITKNYINELSQHEDFAKLMRIVDSSCPHMSADTATCMLLYLKKMGISRKHETMQKLVVHCEQLLKQLGPQCPLTALSRFTVAIAIHNRKGIWPFLVWQNVLPLALNRIETCENAEEFRLLTICFNNIHQMIGKSTLEQYKKKAESLIESKAITAKASRAVVKAINFLNYPHWSQDNTSTIRTLILVLKGSISHIDPRDLVYLHKVFQSQLEPADVLEEIQHCASKVLSNYERDDDQGIRMYFSTELLACVVSFSSPSQKGMFEELARRHINGESFVMCMPPLFMILRHLKTANIQLCDLFWTKTLDNLNANQNFEREDYKLLRIAHRYMHFNNNLGGTYRHYEFENRMKEWLTFELESGVASLIPAKFARVAAFMLAYSLKTKHRSSSEARNMEYFTNKLLEMEPQFSVMDCLNISRGLQISMELRNHRNMPPNFIHQFVNVNAAMNRCARRQLEDSQTSLSDINMIMRAYINRKGPRDTDLISKLIKRYETNDDSLSSRLVRDVTFNLQATGSLVPRMIDRLVEYIIENNAHVLGDTAEKVLYLCYSLGHTPKQAAVFMPAAADLIFRDKERMSGLSLLHAALSLCFFQSLPESLISTLFSVEFLERLDEEISHCYSKATYPVRMRHHMMQLNRAVCLDYPDADVPWFHKKYCQDIASLEGAYSTKTFPVDVLKSLTRLIGSSDLVQTDVLSHYSYKIDFQILLNEKNNPVHARRQADSKITRVAILLYKDDAYCTNVGQLRGQQQLQQRHLEMLGYRVIGIRSSVWNSMYMTEPKAKDNYLHDKIWPGNVDTRPTL